MKKVTFYSAVSLMAAAGIVVACTSLVKSGDRFPSSENSDTDRKREVVATHMMNAEKSTDKATYMMTKGEVRLAGKKKSSMMGMNSKLAMAGAVPGQTPLYVNNPNAFMEPSKGDTQKSGSAASEGKKSIEGNEYHDAIYQKGESPFKFSSISASNLKKNGKFSLAASINENEARAKAKVEKTKSRRPQQYSPCAPNSIFSDDFYESNDSRTSAYDLSFDENRWLFDIHGMGIQSDDDWFEIYVPNDYRNLTLDARFRDSCGDIDMRLYNSSGDLISTSNSSSDDEYINVTLNSGGYYYVKMSFGNAGNYYDFKYTTSYTGGSGDWYEPNDSRSEAYNLTSWDGNWLSNLHGSATAVTDDYYKVVVTPDYLNMTIDLRFSSGDLDLYLQNSNGTTIATSNSSFANEYINITLPSAGTYYILVKPFGFSSQGTSYDMKFTTTRSTPVYFEDAYEPNNSLSQARVISAGTQISANQFNEDWYKVFVPAGMRVVTVESTFTNSLGDIDIQLLDPNGIELQSSFGNTNSEFIQKTVSTENAYYYVRVLGDNVGNPYNLRVSLASSGPTDDPYEGNAGNNTLATAYDLSSRENIWLSNVLGQGIQLNDDYYKIFMSPSLKKITIDLRFVYPNGSRGSLIDVDLMNSNGVIIARSRSEKKNELIELYLPDSGYYFIKVYGNNGAVPYDLKWTAQPMNLPGTAPAGQVNVFEFYNTKLKRYFVSSRPNELALLDQYRDATEWYRTGYYFRSYANLQAGLSPACRFFVPSIPTHFYGFSQSDCDLVRVLPEFQDEGIDFYIKPPVNGACAPGELLIYRLYNNGYVQGQPSDSNHRYTTSLIEIERMQTLNWTNEGPVGCSPPL